MYLASAIGATWWLFYLERLLIINIFIYSDEFEVFDYPHNGLKRLIKFLDELNIKKHKIIRYF